MAPLTTPARCLASASTSALTISSRSTTTQTTTTAKIIAHRAFSSTPTTSRQTPTHRTVPQEQVPDYPYGPFYWHKQRNEALFGGAKIRFGNIVTGKKAKNRSPRISPRSWLPNRHTKRLWSQGLNSFVRVRMTAHVLHTIDKLGGIDEYLLGGKQKRIKELGPAGWALRWKLIQTPRIQERFAREREMLGLPPKEGAVAAAALAAAAEGPGAPPVEIQNEVDEMIAQEEEFVLGDLAEAEAEELQAQAVERQQKKSNEEQKL